MGFCYLTGHPVFKMTCFFAIFIKGVEFKYTLNRTTISRAAANSPGESLGINHTFSPNGTHREAPTTEETQGHMSAASRLQVVETMTKQEPRGAEGRDFFRNHRDRADDAHS